MSSEPEDFSIIPITEDMFESSMSRAEQAVRDLFVAEYLRDRNAYAAALRCGFTKPYATVYSRQFMEEPYVRRKISAATTADIEADDNVKEDFEKKAKRQVIEALTKEAHYYGPGSSHAARVSAAAKLAAILGMDAPIKIQNENMHRGGVMVVPGIASIEEWEQAAMKQQEELSRAASQDSGT